MSEKSDLVSDHDFIVAWQSSGTLEEAVEKLEFSSVEALCERAAMLNGALMRHGHRLKKLEGFNEFELPVEPQECPHDDLSYYADLSSASGCWTVIHGEAECQNCGERFDAVLEGSWEVDFDKVVEHSTL